jgi:hypothetical protein
MAQLELNSLVSTPLTGYCSTSNVFCCAFCWWKRRRSQYGASVEMMGEACALLPDETYASRNFQLSKEMTCVAIFFHAEVAAIRPFSGHS